MQVLLLRAEERLIVQESLNPLLEMTFTMLSVVPPINYAESTWPLQLGIERVHGIRGGSSVRIITIYGKYFFGIPLADL